MSDADPEYENGVVLGGLISSANPNDPALINALIEQRVLRGWPLEDWMRLREPDGSPMERVKHEEMLRIIERAREVAREAHRREQPDCLECRAEDTN